MRTSPVAWLVAAALACLGYAGVIWWLGGFEVQVAGVGVRSHNWFRPAVLGAVSAAIAAWLSRDRVATDIGRVWLSLESVEVARAAVAVVLVWTAGVSVAYSTATAGGSDSSGYLSQARLFAAGRVTDTTPQVLDGAIPPAALVPLGYTAGTSAGVIVPTYPPGLPLLMAPLALAGERAVHLIVPLFGLLLVWLTMRLGVSLGDPLSGAIAAVFVAVSPIVLFQLFQPMSDIPAAACWLAGLVIANRGTRASAAAAGFVCSVAVLIRPNLLPLVAPVMLVSIVARPAGRLWRAAGFAVAGIPAAVALAWIQHARYGSPFGSGYGAPSTLYSFDHVVPNLARYPRWLTEIESPFIWLWLAAPVWIVLRSSSRRLAWITVAFVAFVWLAYLPYLAFGPHEWFYTRFLLPALPPMMLFAVLVALWAARQLPPVWRTAVVVVGGVLVAGHLLRTADARGAFGFHRDEQRYRDAGGFVRDRLPGTAVVLAAQHSGSVRYYSGRPIVRWDLLDAGALDRTLAALRERGLRPFAVVDADEDADFRRIFVGAAQQAVNSLTPVAEFGRARVYRFDD